MSSETRDVATNLSDGAVAGKVFLYSLMDHQLVRRQCPDGESVFDKVRCNLGRVSIPADRFLDALKGSTGTHLDASDKLVRQLYVKMALIDSKLLELMGAAPSVTESLARVQSEIKAQE